MQAQQTETEQKPIAELGDKPPSDQSEGDDHDYLHDEETK